MDIVWEVHYFLIQGGYISSQHFKETSKEIIGIFGRYYFMLAQFKDSEKLMQAFKMLSSGIECSRGDESRPELELRCENNGLHIFIFLSHQLANLCAFSYREPGERA
jgi:hypothetical protein